MPFSFRIPILASTLLLLWSAGCMHHSYRSQGTSQTPLSAEESKIPPTKGPTLMRQVSGPSLLDQESFPVEVELWSLQPFPEVQNNAAFHAELALNDKAKDGKATRYTQVQTVSFQQAEELPTPEPNAIEGGEELASPNSLATEKELIQVPIPPRPLGLLKRFLRFMGWGEYRYTSSREAGCPDQQTASLSMETPLFSPSGENHAPDRWWRLLGDPRLNHQIESSLGGNFTLDAALQRLRAAEALARREASDLWPDVNAFATGEGAFRTFSPNDGLFALGLDASYQVDLWGQIRSRVEAEQLRASATAEDYQAIALTLSAEIARTWFALIEAHGQIGILQEQYETNLQGVKLVELRFGFGGGGDETNRADVLRQRQLAESTREQMIIARSRVDVLEHRLAVLQGRPPQEATYDVGSSLPTLPPLPATGLPSELLQTRPDVRRDYLAIVAADRDLASAISAQYPRLNLAGSVSTLADDGANLFRDWIFAIAGQVVAPLIDGGQRRAEVDRTFAVLQQLVADYGQTVLNAFSEVEDALALERYQRQRIESLDKQYNLAQQAQLQLVERYTSGEEVGDTRYLDVLTATTSKQQLQRDLLSARLDLILTRISLYLALGGGFNTDPLLIGGQNSPDSILHERPSKTGNIAPLDSDPDLTDRQLMHPGRGSRRPGSD